MQNLDEDWIENGAMLQQINFEINKLIICIKLQS